MDNVAKTADADRIGDWMITYTGRRFWPLDPRPEDVDFRDIGHALSLICRYGGHVRRFYSVAEHCNLLAKYFLERGDFTWARYALLHDAEEAYIGDMIRPLKPSMPAFKAAGSLIEQVVLKRAGLDLPLPHEIHEADAGIIGDEARALFRPETLEAADWVPNFGPLGVAVVGDAPHVAEREFASLFARLFPELQERASEGAGAA